MRHTSVICFGLTVLAAAAPHTDSKTVPATWSEVEGTVGAAQAAGASPERRTDSGAGQPPIDDKAFYLKTASEHAQFWTDQAMRIGDDVPDHIQKRADDAADRAYYAAVEAQHSRLLDRRADTNVYTGPPLSELGQTSADTAQGEAKRDVTYGKSHHYDGKVHHGGPRARQAGVEDSNPMNINEPSAHNSAHHPKETGKHSGHGWGGIKHNHARANKHDSHEMLMSDRFHKTGHYKARGVPDDVELERRASWETEGPAHQRGGAAGGAHRNRPISLKIDGGPQHTKTHKRDVKPTSTLQAPPSALTGTAQGPPKSAPTAHPTGAPPGNPPANMNDHPPFTGHTDGQDPWSHQGNGHGPPPKWPGQEQGDHGGHGHPFARRDDKKHGTGGVKHKPAHQNGGHHLVDPADLQIKHHYET